MRNKLIFEGNTDKKIHQWGKYNVGRGKHYTWNKSDIASRNVYNWDKYEVVNVEDELFIWEKYSTKNVDSYYSWEKVPVDKKFNYSWDKYNIIPAGNLTYSWNKYQGLYDWEKYSVIEVPQYRYEYSLSPNTINQTPADFYLNDPKNGKGTFNLGSHRDSDYTKIGLFKVKPGGLDIDIERVIFGKVIDNTAKGFRFAKQSALDSTSGVISYSGLYSGYSGMCAYVYWNTTCLLNNGSQTQFSRYDTTNQIAIGTKIFGNLGGISNYLRVDLTQYPILCPDYDTKYGQFINGDALMRFDVARFGNEFRNIPIMCKKISDDTFEVYLSNIKINKVEYTQTQIGTTYGKGAYLSNVSSDSPYAYPKDDYQGSNWYIYQGEIAGEFVEKVISTESNAYIENQINSDGYFYSGKGQDVAFTDTKGSYVSSVTSFDRNKYKDDGVQDGYWYVFRGQKEVPQYFTSAKYVTRLPINSSIYYSKTRPVLNRDLGTYTNNYQGSFSSNELTPSKIEKMFADGNVFFTIGGYSNKIEFFELIETSSYDAGITNVFRYNASTAVGTVVEYGAYSGIKEKNTAFHQEPTNKKVVLKNEYLSEVSDTNRQMYPDDGIKDGFWYVYSRSTGASVIDKGVLLGQAHDYVLDTYPKDGVYNGVWYVYKDYTVEYYAGSYVETVTSVREDEFPQAGIKNGYWYDFVSSGEDNFPSSFIDFVTNLDPGAYPNNAEQDGYWYIYIGLVKEDLYTLTDSELLEGVNYKQNINPEEDFAVGCATCAEITFKIAETELEAQKYVGLTARYYCQQGENTNWTLIGKFIVNSCSATGKNAIEMKGYDNISLFDVYIDDWLNTIKFPITLKDFYQKLCEYCKVPFGSGSFTNKDFKVRDNFKAVNITGRQILQYIAEASASYACADINGNVVLKTYVESGIKLDSSRYKTLKNAIYETKDIDRLIVQMSEADIGVQTGNGENVYKITSNPLFFVSKEEDIKVAVENIFSIIKQVKYTPCEIELYQDFGIKCGDIITVDGMTAYVMSKDLSPNGIKIKCVGNKERHATGESSNSEIVALRGKTNELTRTIEETNSRLTDTEKKLQSEITQSANEIKATVSYQGETITQIQQNLDGIKLTYNSANGTASITIGDVTVSQLTDKGYVDKTVAGINLKGYVTFESLSNPGQTTINGNNITTGTISADRINMNGAIAWNDFSDSTKQTIVQYAEDAASAVSGVPSYIQSTYIDSTKIYSPKIYGAEITAGTTTDGYIQMASNGLNFKSKTGGSLIGIGYYAGNYNLPYIVLGQGVDSYGTDRGLIKKFTNGIWIGDSDNMISSSPGGTGLFVDFRGGTIYKYINGSKTAL